MDLLADFRAVYSEDAAQTDMDLVHEPCGGVVCTIESGDTLGLLAAMAQDHICTATTEETNR